MTWVKAAGGAFIISLLVIGIIVTTGIADVDKDKICRERYGADYFAKNTTFMNKSAVMLHCTNGSDVKSSGVKVISNS